MSDPPSTLRLARESGPGNRANLKVDRGFAAAAHAHADGSGTWTSPHGREHAHESKARSARAKREAEDIERISAKYCITPQVPPDESHVPPF